MGIACFNDVFLEPCGQRLAHAVIVNLLSRDLGTEYLFKNSGERLAAFPFI